MAGEDILFVNSVEDPWKYAGMVQFTENTSSNLPNSLSILIDCNNCAHCQDLRAPTGNDTPSMQLARKKIKEFVSSRLTVTEQEKLEFEQSQKAEVFLQ